MNPIAAQALGAIARWALAIVAGYLIEAGVWTKGDAETYITAASLAAVALAWSLWQKYNQRLKLVTAIAMPKGVTERQVETAVDMGHCPSVNTPKDVPPVVKSAA